MKPGFQRDLLAVFHLLFDDFAMDDREAKSVNDERPREKEQGNESSNAPSERRKNGRRK